MAGPVLTVVCAMRNMAHCVEAFLDSYRSERTPETRLVVMDAASNDGTLAILERNRDIIDVLVSERDKGIYDAWNKALPLCDGRYVAFIGADDQIADGALRHLVSACQKAGDDAELIAGYVVLTRNGAPYVLWGGPYDPKRLHLNLTTAQILSAHRLEWLREAGGFDASYRSSGDYDLLLRERARLRVIVINKILAYMEDGGTSRASWRPFVENFRARRRHGVPWWLNSAIFVKVALGSEARRLGLRQ